MDASDHSSPRSRQLQGPRPPRLAVSKDSHKVKKPPVAPQPRGAAQPGRGDHHHHHNPPPRQPQQQQQHRAPVIIYDASPKVIHTRPSEFMALVQRLTGPGAPPAEQQQPQQPIQFQPQEFMLSPTAALSPAARYAAIERSVRPLPLPPSHHAPYGGGASFPGDPGPGADLFDGFAAALGPSRSGILSPMPSALPPAASSGLFSPLPFDPSAHSWLNDLSPFLPSAGARDAPFAPSPRTSMLLSTPTMPSPATVSVLEFFSYFPDL